MPHRAHEHGLVKCICKICTCGAHKCPPTPTERQHYEPSLESDYRKSFKGGSVPVHKIAKPEYIHASQPFDGTTNYKDNFIPLDYAQRSKILPKAGAVTLGYLYGDQRKFQPGSMYRDNFTGKTGDRAQGFKPTDTFLKSGKFDADTTSRAAFNPHPDSRPREPFKPQSKLHTTGETRDWETERTKNFGPKGYAARPAFKPVQSAFETAGPFNAQSMSKTDFPDWKDAKPATPFIPAPTIRDGTADDRKFETENRSGFTNKGNAQRAPFKQIAHTHTTNAPLNAESTLKAHFPHWKGARPSTPADHTQNIESHKEDRDFTTDNRSNFGPKKSAAQIARPQQAIVLPKEDRDFTTTSASNIPAGNHTRQPFVPATQLHQTNAPFVGESTAKGAYKGAVQPTRPSFKPKAATYDGAPDGRDFGTEARTSYMGANPEPCESNDLKDRHLKLKPGHKNYLWHHAHKQWFVHGLDPPTTPNTFAQLKAASVHLREFSLDKSQTQRALKAATVGAGSATAR